MSRRILAIVVAIALAGLGSAGVLIFAFSADSRARSDVDGVTVAVAAKRIPIGVTGARINADQLVRLERMPRASVPSDALTEVSAGLNDLVLTSTVEPGQLLLAAMFAERAVVTSGLSLPDGTLAITVETGVPEQVAGYVRPGAKVAMFLTYKMLDAQLEETSVQRTRVLLPSVEVLSTGIYQPPTKAGGDAEAATGGAMLVTVAVSQQDAERLIQGLNTGKLYLGLLTDTTKVVAGPGVQNTDTSGGVNPLFP